MTGSQAESMSTLRLSTRIWSKTPSYGPRSIEISVAVFPIPEGAKKTPLQPGVCGKGSGGFRKFHATSGGRFKDVVGGIPLFRVTSRET